MWFLSGSIILKIEVKKKFWIWPGHVFLKLNVFNPLKKCLTVHTGLFPRGRTCKGWGGVGGGLLGQDPLQRVGGSTLGWGWVRGEGVYPLLCGGLYSPWGLSNTGKYVCVVYGYAFIYATIVHYALLPKAGIFKGTVLWDLKDCWITSLLSMCCMTFVWKKVLLNTFYLLWIIDLYLKAH